MKRSVSIGLFLLMALVVWWSITRDYSQQHLQAEKDEHYIELFMNRFELTRMTDNGRPAYRLKGEHLQRYNDAEETEIRRPEFYLLQAGRQWKISADSALLNNAENTIVLNDNVVMQQQAADPAMIMRTQKLLIHTKKQLAQTDEMVDIERGDSYLQARGMIYNNLSNELQLKSQVRGYYLPYE